MDLIRQDIALRRLRLLTATGPREPDSADPTARMLYLTDLAALGFLVTNPSDYERSLLVNYLHHVVPTLVAQRGGDVGYAPLFPGFPNEIPTDSPEVRAAIQQLHQELFGGTTLTGQRLDHHTIGWWPVSSVRQDPVQAAADKAHEQTLAGDSNTEWIELTIAPVDEVDRQMRNWLSDSLYSPTSVKQAERADLMSLLVAYGTEWIDFSRVAFRETRSLVLQTLWTANAHDELVRTRPTPTDLLRLFATLTDTDASLASPIRFPKLTKAQRRVVLTCLDRHATDEEMVRYRGLWLRLGEYLHPGVYRNRFPEAFERFVFLRANRRVPTSFSSTTERLHATREIGELVSHLQHRPTVFARRLRHVLIGLSMAESQEVLDAFAAVAADVPVKALLTLRVHLETVEDQPTRAVVNKAGKVRVVPAPRGKLGGQVLEGALGILDRAIESSLGQLSSWEGRKVWIDPSLYQYVAPFQQRAMTDGLLNVARGTRLPLDTSKVLRLFVYWHEAGTDRSDLDLSAVTLDREMKLLSQVSYTRLRGQGIVHSGDLTSAPDGAAEFIDITLDHLEKGSRYVVPQIYRYSGPAFGGLPRAHAGWMIRTRTDADYKSFDIKTVQNCFDLQGAGSFAIPFIVDLGAREIIYTDLFVGRRQMFNRVETHVSNISAISREIDRFAQNRPTLGQLVERNAHARRATVVDSRAEADLSFGVESDCDFRATDVAKLNATLLP